MSTTEHQEEDAAPSSEGDSVAEVVEHVRRDLADRRAAGTLPPMPAGELDRQFDAVIEAVDAGLVEEPPLEVGDLAGLAVLETWRPAGNGLGARVTRPIRHAVSRVVGAIVRRQVDAFAVRTSELVAQLAQRQNRLSAFLARAHLDRIRSLEYRVAELERRIEELQDRRR